ncbi:MAG: multidrug effflux MFS transporter [Rickettsiaceae bacterium]
MATKYLPILLVSSLITCCIEVDISVPSFPDIARYFNISGSLTQMTIAVNFFGLCLSSAVCGPLSDSYGRKKVMLVGNIIMAIGACGCTVADNILFLLLARFIQGLGASTSAVVVFAIVADVYSTKQATKLIGSMNAMITVAMSIAPILGSFIHEYIGWRGNYGTIALISISSVLALYYWLPETKTELIEFRYKKVINDFKRLLSLKSFVYSSLVPSLTSCGWMSFVACSSFLYIDQYDLPIMQYALHQGGIISAFAFTSLYAGKINKFFGLKQSVIYGVAIMLLGATLLLSVGLTMLPAPFLTSAAMMVYGIGSAISYPVIFAKSLEIFPDIKGSASSMIMTMRMLLCAGFVALSSYLYSGPLITVAGLVLLAALFTVILTMKLLQIISFDEQEN